MQFIREHIERKMAAAVLQDSPFPHLVIEDFFPKDTYDDIQRYNLFKHNRGEEWLSRSASANVSSRTPYHTRKQINFHKDAPIEGSAEALAFWKTIRDCFLSDDWFESLILAKYAEFFKIRFGDIIKDADFFSLFRRELFLQRHEPGYNIGPHTDIPTRVFTCIFSFAERDGFEEYGTELLRHKDRLARCWGQDHYPPDDFVIAKVAPYKPNNFLLFFKTRQSFHSVKAITEDVPNQRYGMQYQLYEPVGGIFRDLSAPDLLDLKQKTTMAGQIRKLARKALPMSRY